MCSWKTVVWERVNKLGKWIPYSGEVCQLLEQSFRKNLNSICLGDADVQMKCYTVNLKEFVQISEETGTKCEVRRRLFDDKSAIANHVIWQWRGDSQGAWHCYSTDIMNYIEEAYQAQKGILDLSDYFPSYCYQLNFESMVQKNKRTKYHRPIRRIITSPYPLLKVQLSGNEISNDSIPVDFNNYCRDQVPQEPQASTSIEKFSPQKKPLIKQVSNFWNRLVGSLDSENSSDFLPVGSASKKQCTSKKEVNSFDGSGSSSPNHNPDKTQKNCDSDDSLKYALVNGKPWKQVWPPHTPESQIKPVPGIQPLSEQGTKTKGRRKKGRAKAVSVVLDEVDVLNEFTEELLVPPPTENSEDQVCIICYESLTKGSSYDEDTALVKLQLCSHIFHKSCIKAMYDSGPKENYIQCPTCKTIHGVKHGIQPPGTMVFHVLPYSLPGHPECDTIRIIYDIPHGIQGPEHPNPGKHYSARGFPRHCYLPDNEIGRKILRLLIKAWERKLIFTIGSSSTTGEQNTVTWNEIHHKTEFGFNYRGHGYPDPNYFENVITELAAHGVTDGTYAWFPA